VSRFKPPRFEDLTETTGIPLSLEGAQMMITRYASAASLAKDKRVLEIGCGAGQGLGMVGATAKEVIGGDYSLALLETARQHFGGRFPLINLSAEALPFKDESFDVVLFFEASYYVRNVDKAFDDIARVLVPQGTVLFVNANPERPDFIRSPHSVHYHTANEFQAALERRGFSVSVAGAFPSQPSGAGSNTFFGRAVPIARQLLETAGLVPRTLRGRAKLKRLVYRKLKLVPPELTEGFASVAPLFALEGSRSVGFKVIYIRGTRET